MNWTFRHKGSVTTPGVIGFGFNVGMVLPMVDRDPVKVAGGMADISG
jgi:hypothetical protein